MEHVEENRRRKSTPLSHRPIHPIIRTALSLGAGRAAQRVLAAARAGMIRFLRRKTNGTTTASARTTAPRRRIPSYMEFALRIRETRTVAVKRSHRARHTHARPPEPRVGTRGPGTVLAALGPRRTARWIRGGRKNVQASTPSNFSNQRVPASRAGAGGLKKRRGGTRVGLGPE